MRVKIFKIITTKIKNSNGRIVETEKEFEIASMMFDNNLRNEKYKEFYKNVDDSVRNIPNRRGYITFLLGSYKPKI